LHANKTIAGGEFHTLFIKSDGSLWAMGGNDEGQLGDGSDDNRTSPVQIRSSGIISVAAGSKHSLYIEDNGSLWGMGSNDYGQLGIGSTIDQNTSVHIAIGVKAVAAGDRHTIFAKDDGSLWVMGADGKGQLGDGATVGPQNLAKQILPSGVEYVASGSSHSLFIKSDGTLWGMGWNDDNQLGSSSGDQTSPIQIISNVYDIVSVSGGYSHTTFIRSDGNMSTIGGNTYGQLGDSSQVNRNTPYDADSNVSMAVAGYHHTLYLKKDGSLKAMGRGTHGRLGNGSENNVTTPVELISEGVFNIATGYSHSLYETSHGRMWVTGLNKSGQLGIGSTTNELSPIQFKAADTNQSFTGGMEDQVFNGVLSNPVLGSGVSFSKTSGPYQSGDSNKIEYVQSFTLDSNGSFSLLGRPDWNGTLIFEWHATLDSNNSVMSGQALVTLRAENDAPVITLLDQNLNAITADFNQTSVPENQTLVGYINVVDDNNTVPDLNSTHADGGKFSIDYTNLGDLNGDGLIDYPIKINGAGFNYENPTDLGGISGDRKYFLQIFANDASTQTEVELKIDITDVAEDPLLSSHVYSINIREDAMLSTDTDSWYQKNGNNYPGFTASDPDQATTSLVWSMLNQGPQKGTMQWSVDSQMLNASSNPLSVTKGSMVYFNYIPDANKTGADSFTLKVEDEASNTDTISFTVTITAVNDDAPIFTSSVSSTSNPFVIASGSTQSFHTLQTSDSDDVTASFSYSKIAGFDSQYFDVSSSSGQVSSTGITSSITHPDEDGDGIYRFQVRATETGTNETVDQWVYVEINEPPHFVDKDGSIITAPISVVISEDESPVSWDTFWSVNLNGLLAIDPGTNGSANINITNWSVSSQGANGVASVSGVAGLIDYQPDANYFGADTFTITATDASGLSGSITFHVTVEEVNDFPVVQRADNSPSTMINIHEGSRFVIDFDANDSIDGTSSSLASEHNWHISGTDSSLFYIEQNGSLYFQDAPNREQPKDNNSDNRYLLDIKVSDDGLSFSNAYALEVIVLNVNEPPVFTDNANLPISDPFLHTSGYGFFTRVDIPENSTLVYDPNCTDPEGDSFTYSLGMLSDFNLTNPDFTTNSSSPFNVDPVTGQITLAKAIDYENPTNLVNSTAILSGTSWWADSTDSQVKVGFHLELNATDNGSPPLTSSQLILVVITDENEPVVFQPLTSYSVTEENQFITTLTGTDPEGDVVTYGIEQGFKDDEYFSVNQATGELSFLISPRNFEDPQDNGTNNSYEVRVFAQSSGTSKVISDLVVNVLNANDPPTLDREGSSRVSVMENSSLVLTFNATDEDHNVSYPDLVYVVDGKEVRYQNHSNQISDPYSDGTLLHQFIGAKAVQVADFNRDGLDDILELNSTNLLRVFLNAGNNLFDPPISVSSSTITVSQILVNDLSGDGYPDVVALDSINGRILAWAWDGSDPLAPSFNPLIGAGSSNELASFTNSTQLKTLKFSDINRDGLIDVLVSADGDSRLLWIKNNGGSTFDVPQEILSSADFSTSIYDFDNGDIDSDGDADIILATDANVSLIENIGNGQFNSMVSVYNDPNGKPYRTKIADMNGDERADIVVSVDRASNGFLSQNIVLINSSTNPLSYVNPIYFSEGNLISHFDTGDLDNDDDIDLITISHSGNLEFFENSGNGNLNLIDSINSSKGSILSPKLANFDNRLDDMKFSVSGGKDQSLFEFRPNMTPSLWFKNPPDYEISLASSAPGFGPNEYEVIVKADSLGADGSTKSVFHTLTVEVQNLNDNSPVINTLSVFTTDENQVSVTNLSATDADGDNLNWSLNGGIDDGLFALSSNGSLSFKTSPDYENPGSVDGDNQFLVSVRVSDGSYNVDQNLSIDLSNLNDTAPVVHNQELNGVYKIPVLENQFSVLELNVTDADGSTVSKTILPGDDSLIFRINSLDIIEFISAPDYEMPLDFDADNIYEFKLSVSDQVHTQVIPVFVEVGNVNDQQPIWQTTGGNYPLPENQNLAIDLNASDDFNSSIVFYLDPTSPDFEFFDLNTSSGELTFKSGIVPDFEKPSDLSLGPTGLPDGTYEVLINLSDPLYDSGTQKFVLSITDVDEFPSYTNTALILNEDTVLNFGSLDFNITDPEQEDFQLSLFQDSANGKVIGLGGGQFSYEPNPDFFGADSFSLQIKEGDIFANFKVQVTVLDINDPPSLQSDAYDYTFANREPFPMPVLENDTSLPDDNSTEILEIVNWRIEMNASTDDLSVYDWSQSLPSTTDGPFRRGSDQFLFTPPAGFIGPVSIIYTVSDGDLTAETRVKINVTRSPELPGWKYFAEFGYFYLEANGWALHEKIGWIYLADPDALLNATAWCWSESLGWFWTGRSYFDYIYVNEFSKWMQWQGGVNEPDGWSLMTDYATKEVVSSKVFQIQRAAATISAFSNSTEVINYVQNSDLFSTQDKQEIVRELIFTKSSETLVSYGIQLSF